MKKVTIKPTCPHCGSNEVGVKEYKEASVRFRCKNKECEADSFTLTNKEIEELEKESNKLEESIEKLDKGIDIPEADLEIIKESVRVAKSRQMFMDKNRVQNKTFREYARLDNTLEVLNENLIKILKENNLKDLTIAHDSKFDTPVGIIQISDTHFGEVVKQSSNTYNWDIATKRLKKLVVKSRIHFDALGVENVMIAFTGDLMNSDRRLDEMLTNSENRMQTMFLAVEVLKQLILDLNQSYNVSIGSITGNESRVKDEMMFSIVSDNYDYSIHNILKMVFDEADGITFINGQWDEKVVEINGKNILMCHGHNLKASGLDTNVQKMIGKYASEGILIHFVIFGHIHSASISDNYARSSSLVGDNSYSNKALNLSGRASQNIHIIYEDGIDSMKIDLQETNDIDGYNYNSKYENYYEEEDHSANTTIFKVVI